MMSYIRYKEKITKVDIIWNVIWQIFFSSHFAIKEKVLAAAGE